MDDPCVSLFFSFSFFFWERLSYLFLYFFGGSQYFFFLRGTEIWGGRSQDKRNGITTNEMVFLWKTFY